MAPNRARKVLGELSSPVLCLLFPSRCRMAHRGPQGPAAGASPVSIPRTNAEMEALRAQQMEQFKRNNSANTLTTNLREQCTARRVPRRSVPDITNPNDHIDQRHSGVSPTNDDAK